MKRLLCAVLLAVSLTGCGAPRVAQEASIALARDLPILMAKSQPKDGISESDKAAWRAAFEATVMNAKLLAETIQ